MRLAALLLASSLCCPAGAEEPRVHFRKLRIAGVAVTSTGLSLLGGGAIVSLVPALFFGPFACGLTDAACWPGVRWSGVALLGAGAALVSVGVPLWVVSKRRERAGSGEPLVLSVGANASGAITTQLVLHF
jgi:hypothetical protein